MPDCIKDKKAYLKYIAAIGVLVIRKINKKVNEKIAGIKRSRSSLLNLELISIKYLM